MSFVIVRTETNLLPPHIGYSRPFVGVNSDVVKAAIDEMAGTHGTKVHYLELKNGSMRLIKDFRPSSARLTQQPVTDTIFVGVITYPDGHVAGLAFPEMADVSRRLRRAYPNVKYDGNTAVVDTQYAAEHRRLQIWKCDINGCSREVPASECEVCCSKNITEYQGHCYDCHDCAAADVAQ